MQVKLTWWKSQFTEGERLQGVEAYVQTIRCAHVSLRSLKLDMNISDVLLRTSPYFTTHFSCRLSKQCVDYKNLHQSNFIIHVVSFAD